jgi:hypothetical protein
MMANINVTVDITDLKQLAFLVGECDYRNRAPSIKQIDDIHALITKMAGQHVDEVYAPDDEKAA